MKMQLVTLLLMLLAGVYFTLADEHQVSTPNDRLSNLVLPTELSGPLMHMLVSGGGFIVGILILSVIIALILPIFGWKICYLLGNCDQHSSASTYDYHTFNQPGATYGSTAYQKRSMEYVKPILTTLLQAYEKYTSTKKENVKL